ncbi:MAG TPA: DEAD/DEAH box helicase family protein [Nitrospirota bacterium]|nr:DEAD/DEAH box helicase family protein [Nitrospirota bacterium]
MSDKKVLLKAIAKEEELLSKLNSEREQALSRLNSLKQQLTILEAACAKLTRTRAARTPQEKVKLFRSLFHGREDLFPKLWTSRTGKKGYSPACKNEWVTGTCGKTLKPLGKCSECANRKFLPITDQVIMDHLQGRHVIGVYPMLPDDTSWFLAADFDNETWKDDVAAFRETCKNLRISVAIERSRSGNGAHAWFFFAAPVPAATARTMGCYLITETMSRRHQLSMESYDRLFPSQDNLPKGGFGNLIALPFQHEPRQKGNTVFLDENFTPYTDQWEYLASINKLQPEAVQRIADEAIRQDSVTGVPRDTDEDAEKQAPWNRTPSRGKPKKKIIGKFPSVTHCTFLQRLYVEKKDLPSPFLTRIKRLAAFQNPMFYEKQSLRLSTARIPRVISCFEEHPEHIAIPRGCLDSLQELFMEHGVKLVLDDKRIAPAGPSYSFNGTLREAQQEAIDEIFKYDLGVLSAPPGFGKTVIGARLIAKRGCRTLVLVHRKELLDQWIARLSLFLGIDPREIGRIGAGKNKPNGILDVAMIQSLVRKDEVNDMVAVYGHVIVDECHHLPAVSFERVLNEVKARYIVGLTATPYRRDGHQPIIHMQCGPIRYAVHPKSLEARARFKHQLICRTTDFAMDNPDSSIQQIYAGLVSDERRNNIILTDVRQAIQEGRSPVLLTERKEHLDILTASLQGEVKHLIVLSGRLSPKERRETMARLDAIPDGEARLIAATGRYLGEGFDDPRLDTLILAMPFSWKGTIVQYAGRLHREHPGKLEVRVHDYIDANVPKLLRMHKKRLRGFRDIGYTVVE